MGRGPQEAIMRKLIRKYFKFDLKKRSFAAASKYLPELQDSWEKNGINSKESDDIQAKMDALISKDESDYRALKKSVKKYPIMMNNYLGNLKKQKTRSLTRLPLITNENELTEETKDPFGKIKF
jgi:hypothetical protein